MSRRALAAVVLCLVALTASVGIAATRAPGYGPLIREAQALRGLRLLHPLKVHVLGRQAMALALRRAEAASPDPTAAPPWDDALHLLGVLRPEQRLSAVVAGELQGQVAGFYDPSTKTLDVLRSGGGAPPSVVVHETTHALQDQHFNLSAGAFRERTADADGGLAARSLAEGDAVDVQERYLMRAGLVAQVEEGIGALDQLVGAGAGTGIPPYLERRLLFPYAAGQPFVAALRTRGGERLVNRAFRHPPRTTAAILSPARYLAGDPPAVAVGLPVPGPGERRTLRTTFGAGDLDALTGQIPVARLWLGGALAVDRSPGHRGLWLRVAARAPRRVAAALRKVLPARDSVSVAGRLVTVHAVQRL
jgi:hypothetical protein